MIDLPLTHIRPDEVRVSVEKLRSLGYMKDTHGYDLQNGSQVIEMHPQDLLVSDSCAEYMVSVAQFMDDLLVKLYGLRRSITSKSPKTSSATSLSASPRTRAPASLPGLSGSPGQMSGTPTRSSMRQNAGTASTAIPRSRCLDGREWEKYPIRKFVLENFDLSQPGIDRLGTYYSDPARPFFTRTRRHERRRSTSGRSPRSPSTGRRST